MIRTVLFDLDRTLMDRDRAFASFAASQYARFAEHLGGITEADYVKWLVRLDALGSVGKEVVYREVVEILGTAGVSWETLFQDFDSRTATYYVPFPGMHEMLQALSRDYRLGLITNGRGAFQQRTIDTLNLSGYFGAILISGIEGVRKPDAEIFRRALQKLGCDVSKAVYVGDNPQADIEGARAAGMKALWKRNNAYPERPSDGAFDDLREIASLVKNL